MKHTRIVAFLTASMLITAAPVFAEEAETDFFLSEDNVTESIHSEATGELFPSDLDMTADAVKPDAEMTIGETIEETLPMEENDKISSDPDILSDTTDSISTSSTEEIYVLPVLDSGMSNEEMFEAYFQKQTVRTPALYASNYGYTRFADDPYAFFVYSSLRERFTSIAENGGSTSFVLRIPVEEDDYDTSETDYESAASQVNNTIVSHLKSQYYTIFDSLMADCPYEMYWYDKTVGLSTGQSQVLYDEDNRLYIHQVFHFRVAEAFQDKTSANVRYTVTSDVTRVQTAAATARSIVEKYAAEDEWTKMISFKDEICALSSYNHSVGASSSYGDPWQLIYVFDSDPETQVVCEGFSKAFQYLCDLSLEEAYVYIVTGRLGTVGHMWNIVNFRGVNYHCDVTNSALSQKGTTGDQFLVTGTNTDTGYTVGGLSYRYDDYTRTLYSSEMLTLGSTQGNKYTIAYDANGGTNIPDAQIKNGGVDLILSNVQPNHETMRFAGWSAFPDAKEATWQSGDIYVQDEDIVLYAVWKDIYYEDVSASAYYSDAVIRSTALGIVSGKSETIFSPNASCSRAEAVTFLWRIAGCPKPQSSLPFTDVNPTSYAAEAITWAAENGVTKGRTASSFVPSASITRAEFVTMLYQFSNSPAVSGESPFADVIKNKYYYNAVIWGYQTAICKGVSETVFGVGTSCTRAQAVTILYRFISGQ